MNQVSQNSGDSQRSSISSIIRKISNLLLILFAVQFLANKFLPKSTPPRIPYVPSNKPSQVQGRPEKISPMWPTGSSLDLRIYISPHFYYNDFREDNALWTVEGLRLGDWHDTREKSFNFQTVQNNGTLFAHTVICLAGTSPNPRNETYKQEMAFHIVKLLNRYMPLKKYSKAHNLLSSKQEQEINVEKGEIGSHWHENMTLAIVADQSVISYASMTPVVAQHIHLDPTNTRDETGTIGFYYPIVYHHDFWQLKDSFYPINSTLSSVPLNIRVQPLSFMKFQLFSTFDEGFKRQEAQGAAGIAEVQEMKRVILETNVWLLTATFLVSVLHSLFEFLAFKNDIAHWRSKKDNTGISIRTIFSNVIMQTIILLYLFDQNEQTSWIILGGQGFGILLEAWKITKTVDLRIEWVQSIIPWRVQFIDKHVLSDTEAKTKDYDQIAFKYLFWVAAPLLVGYAIYSFLYEEHKGYYSFIVTTLVGFVYTWGFLMMVPSLYINYRLKSVAHMPARTMIYKFLNTFIDDLFAFIIKMPMLHRIATLRDDVIFFIYLYQCYLYPVDKSRPNEFGQTVEGEKISTRASNEKEVEEGVKVERKKDK